MIGKSTFNGEIRVASAQEIRKGILIGMIDFAFRGIGLRRISKREVKPFPEIPNEVLIHIFSFLSSQDLKKCWFVNKQWSSCAQAKSLWHALCRQNHIPLPPEQNDPIRDFYRFDTCWMTKKKFKQTDCEHADLKACLLTKGAMPSSRYAWHDHLFIYSNPLQKQTKLWDLTNGKCLSTINDSFDFIDFDHQSSMTVQKKEKMICKHWTLSGKEIISHELSYSHLDNILLSNDRLFITHGRRGAWLDRKTNAPVGFFFHPGGKITALAHLNQLLALGSEKGEVIVWDLRAQKRTHSFKMVHCHPITHLAFYKSLVIASYSSSIKMWDPRNPKRPLTEHSKGIKTCLDLQRNFLALGVIEESYKSDDFFGVNHTSLCSVKLWDVDGQKEINTLLYEENSKSVPWGIRWTDASLFLFQKDGQLSLFS